MKKNSSMMSNSGFARSRDIKNSMTKVNNSSEISASDSKIRNIRFLSRFSE